VTESDFRGVDLVAQWLRSPIGIRSWHQRFDFVLPLAEGFPQSVQDLRVRLCQIVGLRDITFEIKQFVTIIFKMVNEFPRGLANGGCRSAPPGWHSVVSARRWVRDRTRCLSVLQARAVWMLGWILSCVEYAKVRERTPKTSQAGAHHECCTSLIDLSWERLGDHRS